MKTIDFLYGGVAVASLIIAVIAFVKAFKSNKKKIDEFKSKMGGRVLGDDDIPGRYVEIQHSEWPFIPMYDQYN